MVFHKSLTINLSKKTKKTLSFFSFFQGHDQKKTKKLEENQKKPNMSLRPNILWKVLVSWFFGFIEVFCFLVFSRFSQQNLRSRNVRSVFDIGVAIMFSLFCRHISKNTFHYRPLVSTISGNLFQTSFFEDRTCSKGSSRSLLSLKTGLFQREVACKEESSIWTNRLSVKHGFF